MRIAQLAPLAESVPPKLYGGTERVVSYLTEELVKQRHEVTLYASADSVAEPDWAVARHLDDPAVARALRDTPQGRAMAQFARFLTAEVDSSGPGVVVYLRDARYARAARDGWGVVAVRMDRAP